MNYDNYKLLSLIQQPELKISINTWLDGWFKLTPLISEHLKNDNNIIFNLIEKNFATTHQKGRRNQHPDLARLEFFLAYNVHIWLYGLVNTGLNLTHAQDRVAFYLKSTNIVPNGSIFPNELNLGNIEKTIQRNWRTYLPQFKSGKQLNDFTRGLTISCKRPRSSDSEFLQWEYEYVSIINILIRTYQHASIRFAETRTTLRECIRYPDSALASGENQAQAVRAVLGNEHEQKTYSQSFFEKIQASFYGVFNVGLWRDEDHDLKYMYEIANHLGYAYYNIAPTGLSKQAHEIIDLWSEEVAESGKDALSTMDEYTVAIRWLLQKDVEIHNRSDTDDHLPEISLIDRFNIAAMSEVEN